MDWDLAIKRNSEALKGIIEALFAMLGLVGEATVSRIPQPLHSAVLRLLHPAESAMRRLIVIAARGLVVKLAPSRPMPARVPSARAAEAGVTPFSYLIRGKTSQSDAPQNIRSDCPAHPYLWKRSPGGGTVGSTPARGRSRSAARWPRECRTPQPQAPGPQAGA